MSRPAGDCKRLGRIHAVERLVGTEDPMIRSWLLPEGFRNDVMDEYLAHLAATGGHLHEAPINSICAPYPLS